MSQPLESIFPSPGTTSPTVPRDTGSANVGTEKFLLQNTHTLALPNKASITHAHTDELQREGTTREHPTSRQKRKKHSRDFFL
jgi:hypothetical protein